MIEIEFYNTIDGRCPVEEYLDSLNPKLLAKTIRTIDLLENNGTSLRAPYSKPIGNGVFELRAKQGSDITRIMYFFFIGNKAVLTNGFTKKTQRTPKSEIELAKKYKADYERRQKNELPEYDLIQAMIDARISENLTQKELSERTGITQADISRIENGTRNPSLAMLKRLAEGLGMQLRLEFVRKPIKQ